MALTYWRKTINYVNSLSIGEIFTRQELYENVYNNETGNFKRLRRFENAIDHYRRYLVILKFIDHFSMAKYRKIKDVPILLTASLAEKISYNKDWKDWFILDINERIEVELNEKETRIKTCREIPNNI